MPSRKRSLAEADPNASHPSSKRPAEGKENAAPGYSSQTVAQLAELLKERGLPHTGKKAALIERLESMDRGAPPEATSAKAPTGKRNQASTETSLSARPSSPSKPGSCWIGFVTRCRPARDMLAEEEEKNEDFDPDEAEDLDTCGTEACLCKESARDHPGWKWLVSWKGFDLIQHLRLETLHRDQDYMDEYHYNDFSGYGFQEVVNNQLQSFHTEYTKKVRDLTVLWAHVEAITDLIPGSGAWFRSDDSQQILASLELVGRSILATLELLEGQGYLREDGGIKNIPLVLSQCLEMVEEWPGEEEDDELGWRFALIQMADRNGITITGPYGIEKKVAELREEGEENGVAWKKSDWRKEFKNFLRDYSTGGGKIGGTYYDLSKQEKGKRAW